jgi:predicted dehydrogenase
VYIATLPDSHAKYSIVALQSGKAVLCEKPSAESGAKLEEILHVAKERRVLWKEAMKPPFYPLFKQLKAHLKKDPIGSVQFVRTGSSLANVSPQHPSFNKHNAGEALLGIGVYGAFLATEWLGGVVTVNASGRFGETGVDVFACCQVLLRYN